ncbi:threonine/serine exporter ThrE family protein [Parabacteroides sp. Marseille-P3160]|uniref:threonine/serine ThrE exporter family protein n=1 Tax=Parabacteroides sp. Marseille-P3160 TaxID=1917887 RepID=UPI0009BA0E0D|nr:threonine/serine exporter family protein [Parabacteroides sp. Marseille-P3160]
MEQNKALCDRPNARRVVDLILDVSVLLIESGAHCGRISRNVKRLADTLEFKVELFISFSGICATVIDNYNPDNTYSRIRNVSKQGIHYSIVTEISLLTWDAYEKHASIDEIEWKVRLARQAPKHNIWMIRLFIALASGSLCLLAGGDWVDGTFGFFAGLLGLVTRQIVLKKGFNQMLSIALGSFVATCVTSLDMITQLGASPEKAVATGVLFLIPGVPLINCVIDLIQGFFTAAIARGAYGGFILLSIAIGMFFSMTLFGLHNF